jgi:hypothetical protein
MSYVPSEEALNQYEEKEPSLGAKYKDYLKGLGSTYLQEGAMGGYHLANLPSYAYEAITGKPLYHLPKPDVTEFIPESEAGQFGKEVGSTASDLIRLMAPSNLALRGANALTRYHPLTSRQVGRPFREVEHGIANAEQRPNFNIPMRDVYEASDLLSHPALQAGGSTGKSLTPMGIASLMQGLTESEYPAIMSTKSLLNHLTRALPKGGEGHLAQTRVNPLEQRLMGNVYEGLNNAGLTEEAGILQRGMEAARRHYKTKENIGEIKRAILKPLGIGAVMKALFSGVKKL